MRNVVVTGGSRGLGLAIAGKLAGSGYRVVAIARHDTDAFAQARRAAAAGALHFSPFDLSDTAAIPDLVRGLRRQFGTIYGLVNNAAAGPSGVLARMPDRQIADTLHLNAVSPAILTKYVLRSMLAAGEGRIVNIASVVALNGYGGLAVYSASKAALVGFTRSLAREVGPAGINVNAVAPGFADTELTRSLDATQRERIARRSALQRLLDPADVAEAVAFLLDERSRNITGTVVTVDAGMTA
jgi:3-oxoacyl-[acyl-carrier protein] reductase